MLAIAWLLERGISVNICHPRPYASVVECSYQEQNTHFFVHDTNRVVHELEQRKHSIYLELMKQHTIYEARRELVPLDVVL